MVYIKSREQLHLPFPHAVDDIQTIVADFEEFESTDWRLLVVSKAHRSKAQALTSSSKCAYYIAITSSYSRIPLQTTCRTLGPLSIFLEFVKLVSFEDFDAKFGGVRHTSKLSQFKKSMAPYVLCHVKEDVKQSISPGRSIDSIEHESRQCWNQLSKRLQISYESEMFERASQKIVVEHAVFGSGVFHDGVQASTRVRRIFWICSTGAPMLYWKTISVQAIR